MALRDMAPLETASDDVGGSDDADNIAHLVASIDSMTDTIRDTAVLNAAVMMFTSSRLGGSIPLTGCVDMAMDAIDSIERKMMARSR